jgi:hypothetical protein
MKYLLAFCILVALTGTANAQRNETGSYFGTGVATYLPSSGVSSCTWSISKAGCQQAPVRRPTKVQKRSVAK